MSNEGPAGRDRHTAREHSETQLRAPSASLRLAFEMSSSATLLDMVPILKTICLASLHHMFKSSEFDSKYQNKCFL